MLRIVRCTTDVDRAPDVEAYFARALAGLRQQAGNVDAFVGRHAERSEVRYALVTAWDGFGALQAAMRGDVLGAPLLAPLGDVVRDLRVEHLERMDLPAIGAGGEAAVLRLYAGSISHRHVETFYSFTRDTAWPAVGRAEGLVAAHVGRRIGSDVHHVALVTARRSRDDLLAAFPDAPTPPLVLPGEGQIVAGLHVEHFGAVPPDPSA